MAERIQKQRSTRTEEAAAEAMPEPQDTGTLDALDELLDEIDDVLEENAAAFVASYVQRGGQ